MDTATIYLTKQRQLGLVITTNRHLVGSAILFHFYTHDLTDPYENTEYITYADNVTQIIPHRHKSAARHSLQTAHAIGTIDKNEHKWKIRTNKNKFNQKHLQESCIVSV